MSPTAVPSPVPVCHAVLYHAERYHSGKVYPGGRAQERGTGTCTAPVVNRPHNGGVFDPHSQWYLTPFPVVLALLAYVTGQKRRNLLGRGRVKR